MTKEKRFEQMKKAAEYVIEKNVNSACFWVLHQPKLPSELTKSFQKRK